MLQLLLELTIGCRSARVPLCIITKLHPYFGFFRALHNPQCASATTFLIEIKSAYIINCNYNAQFHGLESAW